LCHTLCHLVKRGDRVHTHAWDRLKRGLISVETYDVIFLNVQAIMHVQQELVKILES
jgi:hypothetical protein